MHTSPFSLTHLKTDSGDLRVKKTTTLFYARLGHFLLLPRPRGVLTVQSGAEDKTSWTDGKVSRSFGGRFQYWAKRVLSSENLGWGVEELTAATTEGFALSPILIHEYILSYYYSYYYYVLPFDLYVPYILYQIPI